MGNKVPLTGVDILSAAFKGYGSLEDVSIPEHDRRILELMVLRRVAEQQKKEEAQRKRTAWQENYSKQKRAEMEREEIHRSAVAAKRSRVNNENQKRLEDAESRFLASQ